MPDEPGTKEPDASHHLPNHARWPGVVPDKHGRYHIGRRAKGDQCIRVKPGGMPAYLALQTDQSTEYNRHD